jgi:hypothetical protein
MTLLLYYNAGIQQNLTAATVNTFAVKLVLSEVRVLPGLRCKRKWPLLMALFFFLSFFFSHPYFSPRRGCPRVVKFCMGP